MAARKTTTPKPPQLVSPLFRAGDSVGQADWLEHQALLHGSISVVELMDDLDMGDMVLDRLKTAENESGGEADDSDLRSKEYVAVEAEGNSAMLEVNRRIRICSEHVYPFTPSENGVVLEKRSDVTLSAGYVFLSCLDTLRGPETGLVSSGRRLFEDYCADALLAYLGGGAAGMAFSIVFQREEEATLTFKRAVDRLINVWKESERPSAGCSRLKDQHMGDDGLDVVAWRRIDDGRPGNLALFAQCASGANWRKGRKERELQPYSWCRKWLDPAPPVTPVRAFCTVDWIRETEWHGTSIDAGIILDRGRLSRLFPLLSDETKRRAEEWTRSVLQATGKGGVN